MPRELNFGEVYVPPDLIVVALALVLAWVTARVMNRLRWTRFFAFPTAVFLSVTAIYSVILGTFWVPI